MFERYILLAVAKTPICLQGQVLHPWCLPLLVFPTVGAAPSDVTLSKIYRTDEVGWLLLCLATGAKILITCDISL